MEKISSIDELYQKYYREVVNWAISMTNDRYIAEDLVQEAFLRAMQHEQQFMSMEPMQCRAWIYQTVKHLYIDRIRHLQNEQLVDMIPEKASDEKDRLPEEMAELLSVLPEDQRQLVMMRYIEGYNSAELSRILGIPAGTIRSKLSTSIRVLRELLQEEDYE